DDRRARLRQATSRVRSGLRELGFAIPDDPTPIIPVWFGDPRTTMVASRALLDRGVFAHGIRPPTVPPGEGRIRVVPIATHSDAHLEQLLAAFSDLPRPT